MAAAVTAAGGGACREEVLVHRVASPSDVNKGELLSINAEIQMNAAESRRGNGGSRSRGPRAGARSPVTLCASAIQRIIAMCARHVASTSPRSPPQARDVT